MSVQTVEPVTNEGRRINAAESEILRNSVVGCRLSVQWLTQSKAVKDSDKRAMADGASTNENGFSASKRLMDSKHPIIKEANELHRRIVGTWTGMTLPMSSFLAAQRAEPGVRMVDPGKIAELDSKLQALVPECSAMSQKINANMTDIKARDQERLKGLFNEADYPTHVALAFGWGYSSLEVPKAVENLPSIRARLQEELDIRLNNTANLGMESILEELLAVSESWLEALQPVRQIYPDKSNELYIYHGAEIRQEVPAEGGVRYQIRYRHERSSSTTEGWFGPFTPEQVKALNISAVGDKSRTFRDSTIEGISGFLNHFKNVKGMLNTSEDLDDMLKTVETHLGKCADAKGVASELRSSRTYRESTHAIMAQVKDRVISEIKTVRSKMGTGNRTITRLKPFTIAELKPSLL